MRFVLVLLAVVSLSAQGQVRLEGELGWQGVAVVGEVNPLWIEVTSGATTPINGQLVVHQRAGSAWRGEGERWMTRRLPLVPGGRSRLVLPWPLLAGEPLTVSYEAEGMNLYTVQVPVEAAAQPRTLVVGRPRAGVSSDTTVVRAADLPGDPTVYGSVAAIRVEDPQSIGPQLGETFAAWEVLLAGRHRAPGSVPHPSAELVRNALFQAGLNGEVWWWHLAGTLAYVVAVAFLLRGWSKASGRRSAVKLACCVCGLILLGAVSPYTPVSSVRYNWVLHHPGVTNYSVAWSGLFSRRAAEEVFLDGLWIDAAVVDQPLVPQEIRWSWGTEGWETRVTLERGRPQIMWALQPADPSLQAETSELPKHDLDPVVAWLWEESGLHKELGFAEHVEGERGTREVTRVLYWPQGR